MNTRLWLFGMALSVAGPVLADADASGKDLDRFAQAQARGIPGAHEVVAGGDGQVQWAGVWMDSQQACPNGRLGEDARRLVADGGRFAGDHDARLILYAPRADAPTVGREARAMAARVEVRGNDQIGEHCYLVIRR